MASPQLAPPVFEQASALCCGLVTSVYLHDWETRASPVRTPPRILLPPLETWACHAKALPHRLLLQVRGETQKEAEELKKAKTLSSRNTPEYRRVQGGY